MPGEDGNIINKVAPDINDVVEGMSEAITEMNEFDASQLQSDMDTAWGAAKDYVANTYVSATLDFSSSYNKAILEKISNPAHSDYDGCTANGFASDSWHPTVSADKTISCYVS